MKQEDKLLFDMYGIRGYTECQPEPQNQPQDSEKEEKGISTCPENKVSQNA